MSAEPGNASGTGRPSDAHDGLPILPQRQMSGSKDGPTGLPGTFATARGVRHHLTSFYPFRTCTCAAKPGETAGGQ